MKTFIFIFALIACLMLAQGTPVDVATEGAFGTESGNPLLKAVPAGPQCNPIGGHCHRSDDCCTLRCASYHSRCVS